MRRPLRANGHRLICRAGVGFNRRCQQCFRFLFANTTHSPAWLKKAFWSGTTYHGIELWLAVRPLTDGSP